MNKVLSFLNKKKIKTPISWIKKGVVLILISLIANHLIEVDNFPLSDTYSFPLFSILTSILIGSFMLIIVDISFEYFKRKYFVHSINTNIIISFLLSTLGFITILYIPCFYVVLWLQDGDYSFYDLVVGLSLTLLISCIIIIALYTKKIYELHKLETLKGKLIIEKSGKKIIVNYIDIAYFYSENKVVYSVESNGEVVSTDFTLNEIESKINSSLFIRANRQTLIHSRSVKEIEAIENGKLLITLQPTIFNKEKMEIVVSRYKKKEFTEWFQNKEEYEPTIQL